MPPSRHPHHNKSTGRRPCTPLMSPSKKFKQANKSKNKGNDISVQCKYCWARTNMVMLFISGVFQNCQALKFSLPQSLQFGRFGVDSFVCWVWTNNILDFFGPLRFSVLSFQKHLFKKPGLFPTLLVGVTNAGRGAGVAAAPPTRWQAVTGWRGSCGSWCGKGSLKLRPDGGRGGPCWSRGGPTSRGLPSLGVALITGGRVVSVLVVVAVVKEAQLPTFDVTELHCDSMFNWRRECLNRVTILHPLQKLTYCIDCFFLMNSLESK